MTVKNLTKGKVRASIFAGVFGLVCILITMFIGYTFTIEVITSTMNVAMILIGILTLWMVYVCTYVLLIVLADLDEKSN